MKKAVVALSIAAALTGLNANAGTVYKKDNGDYLKVYGGAEIGGTFIIDDDKKANKHAQKSGKTYVDDSFATIGLKGQTGKFFGKFEIDAERTNWTTDNKFRLVMDKIYGGYEIAPKHTIEYGRTDTAYDHYDALGDPTADLGIEVGEAGDQDDTLKYRGQFGSIKVGVSYSQRGWDGDTDADGKPVAYTYETDSRFGQVFNGYVGYFGDTFTVLTGAESVDDTGEIYSLHGKAKLGEFTLSGFYSIEDLEAANEDSGSLLLAGEYQFTEKLAGYAVFNMLDHDQDKEDQEWGVVGAEYRYAKNVKLQSEFSFANDETGPLAYLIAYYWF